MAYDNTEAKPETTDYTEIRWMILFAPSESVGQRLKKICAPIATPSTSQSEVMFTQEEAKPLVFQ